MSAVIRCMSLGIAASILPMRALAQDAEVHTAPQGYAHESMNRNQEPRPRLIEENHDHILVLRDAEKRLGSDSPEVAPAILELAAWYMASRQYNEAIQTYKRVLKIQESAYGKEDIRLVPALAGIEQAHWMHRDFRSPGREAMERIVRLYENTLDADAIAHAKALAALGDWYLVTDRSGGALDAYARAWKLCMKADAGSSALAERELGKPRTILSPSASARLNIVASIDSIPEMEIGELVDMELDVTIGPDGSPSDVALVSTSVTDTDRRLRVANMFLARSRFRPGLRDGAPVAMRIRWPQH